MDPKKFVGFVENSNAVFKMGMFEESKLQISQHHHQEKHIIYDHIDLYRKPNGPC